ncbi:MAG TPA: asparagine synthase (glutamine-hydrolyzing) [Rhizomicrobium sp.]|jgi:asparagine synthase (glutamine-hydrolysing)
MCGIAGEARFDGGVTRAPLEAMSRGIRHRGPDDEGLWLEENRNCGFAFRRLSIIDLSPLGHQPMLDPETGNVIVFNGEIYNFQGLRRECEEAGARFRSRSDTEIILALYRRLGPECVKRLRGMFAFAIWDARKEELFLARDRFGKKPLNYALTKSGLVFCSEIGPLSRHPAVRRDHDADALELYLQLLVVPAPWTIYRNIRKLPPAHWAIFSQKGFRAEKYWDLDYTCKVDLSDAEALEGFEERFAEAVRLRMIADVPLGALLSGGVDSSVVVAEMAKHSSMPVKTFSVGFEEQSLNELPHAKEAARICGTDHHEQIVTGDVEHLLPLMARHYGEPFADPSAIPSFLVCRSAREHVTVALTGDGGDELLGGYPRYRISRATLFASSVLGRVVPAERLLPHAVNLSGRQDFFDRAKSRLTRDLIHPEFGSLMNYRGNWHDNARRVLLAGDGNPPLLPEWRRARLEQARLHAGNPVDRMLYFDNHAYLPDDYLVKMDIASMHCSLQTHAPLLDHELAEYCARLPVGMKVRRRTGKYLLKQLAARTFGREFAGRTKQGFGIPLAKWLDEDLRERMSAVLSDPGLMDPFDLAAIASTEQDFRSGRRDHASRLWALFMYGLWRESENDAPHNRADLSPIVVTEPAL